MKIQQRIIRENKRKTPGLKQCDRKKHSLIFDSLKYILLKSYWIVSLKLVLLSKLSFSEVFDLYSYIYHGIESNKRRFGEDGEVEIIKYWLFIKYCLILWLKSRPLCPRPLPWRSKRRREEKASRVLRRPLRPRPNDPSVPKIPQEMSSQCATSLPPGTTLSSTSPISLAAKPLPVLLGVWRWRPTVTRALLTRPCKQLLTLSTASSSSTSLQSTSSSEPEVETETRPLDLVPNLLLEPLPEMVLRLAVLRTSLPSPPTPPDAAAEREEDSECWYDTIFNHKPYQYPP